MPLRLKKTKAALSLLELLVVISLVVSLSFIFMTKGASFVKNYQLNQEKKIFEHTLQRALSYAKMHNCPLEVCLVGGKNKEFSLQIEELKFCRSFKYIHLNTNKKVVYIFPNENLSFKDFGITFF